MEWETLHTCLAALRTHRMRTVLSALGVFFGVGAVIGMLSIGEGAKREALNLIRLMGDKHLIVRAREPDSKERQGPGGLTEQDMQALRRAVPGLRGASPVKILKNAELTAGSQRVHATAYAVGPDYAALAGLRISRGRFFDAGDARAAGAVCVIGRTLALDLFGARDPLGEDLKSGRIWYRVIGVTGKGFEEKGELKGLQIEDVEHAVYLPLETYLMREGVGQGTPPFSEIDVSLTSLDHLADKKKYVELLMKRLHRQDEDVEVVVPLLLLKQKQETQRIFNIVMGCIAGISLLVGGIGIMNIMLTSVLERVREIGLRRAVGATRRNILAQFLLEACLISGSGGMLGILLGFAIAFLVSELAGWTTAVPAWAIVLAAAVSMGIGIVFGYMPAHRAADLQPVDALRWE